jgi:uncharacterized MnhB-related membrane protein
VSKHNKYESIANCKLDHTSFQNIHYIIIIIVVVVAIIIITHLARDIIHRRR